MTGTAPTPTDAPDKKGKEGKANGRLGRAVSPEPFPGKKFPTRVAWEFEFVQVTDKMREEVERIALRRRRDTGRTLDDVMLDADIQAMCRRTQARRLRYIGKPNRYRALQAQRFLQRRPGEVLKKSLEIEFDSAGIMFSRVDGATWAGLVHTAYHPHSASLGPVDSFARKIYRKRVGGLTLYSYKDKLSQDELDVFYDWYEKTFKKKLRRPRGKAAAMAKPAETAPELEPLPEPVPVRNLECRCWRDPETGDHFSEECPLHGII